MIEKFKKNWQSLEEKQRQIFRAFGLIIIVSLLACLIGYFRDKKTDLYDKKTHKIDLSDVKSKGKIEDAWLERSESQLEDLRNQLEEEKKNKEELQQRVEDLGNSLTSIESKNQQQLQTQIAQLKLSSLQNNVDNSPKNSLKNRLALANNSTVNQGELPDPFARKGNLDGSSFAANGADQIGQMPQGQGEEKQNAFDPQYENFLDNKSRQIDLVNFSANNDKNSFSLDNYVPSGSYAKAVLISSVDASVGISAQSDPRPVLFRIINEARSVIDNNKQLTTNIKGCTVTGAASADLSSERVYVRLLKMTCPDGNGGVIETDVEGYGADGSDGKAGLAGRKITREGDLLKQSFWAGLIGGFGQGLSEKVAPPMSFSNGLTTQGTLSNEDVIKKGLGKGISSSSDRLSNYLIDRAEQYQPVIAIASGKEAELVFISGAYLDGRKPLTKVESKKITQE